MSIWSEIKSRLAGGEAEGPSSTVHVIDVSGLAGSNGRGERSSPRDRVQLLQKLAQFVEREQIKAYALVDGRPLREAPDGEVFQTMTVHYAETANELAERALGLARGDALIITQNRELESSAMARGIATMRSSSLRRALDESGGGGRGDRDSSRSGGNRNRRRPRQRRPGGGEGRNRGEEGAAEAPAKGRAKEAPAKDGVSDLIDLV
jgi:hypothetical protein